MLIVDKIIQWIRDFFEKNGKDCPAVVGISGGKDSAVTAALCARALGAGRVFGVLMPRGQQWDIANARALVDFLKIKHCVINIQGPCDAVFKSIQEGGLTVNDQAAINTPARVRMTTLYAVAATVGGLVANTCNLSEDWVGYSTKFGDSAGDFSPLANLTVTEVKALGRELGLPAQFVDKVPEDGLSGMTDEEKLGFTYAVLDKYIRESVCEDAAVKEKIDRMHRLNLHKISLMPCYKP